MLRKGTTRKTIITLFSPVSDVPDAQLLDSSRPLMPSQMKFRVLLALLSPSLNLAQQAGTLETEQKPTITLRECTLAGRRSTFCFEINLSNQYRLYKLLNLQPKAGAPRVRPSSRSTRTGAGSTRLPATRTATPATLGTKGSALTRQHVLRIAVRPLLPFNDVSSQGTSRPHLYIVLFLKPSRECQRRSTKKHTESSNCKTVCA